MTTETILRSRSDGKCELCGRDSGLAAYQVAPHDDGDAETCVFACQICRGQIDNPGTEETNHWRCLNDSMWSQVPAVQVVAWRMLKRLGDETWARDLLDMLYLDEETLAWAESGASSKTGSDNDNVEIVHKDTHGAVLSAGDTVTLIKDLKVKGANFTAKRGTAVRNISLVPDNAAQIEGRVNDQRIVILTEFVKKSG